MPSSFDALADQVGALLKAEDAEACAEAVAWLDTLTTCPHCGGDGAPTGQAFVIEDASDEHAEPIELEYHCGICWCTYAKARNQ